MATIYSLNIAIKFDDKATGKEVVINTLSVWKTFFANNKPTEIKFDSVPDTFPKKAFQKWLIACSPVAVPIGQQPPKSEFIGEECQEIIDAMNGGNPYATEIKTKIIKPVLEYFKLLGSIKKEQNIDNYTITRVQKLTLKIDSLTTSKAIVEELLKYKEDTPEAQFPQNVQNWYNIFCAPRPPGAPANPTDPTPPGKPTDPVTPQQPVIAPPAKTEKIKLATINYTCDGEVKKLEIFSENDHNLRFLVDIDELKAKISSKLDDTNLYDSIWQDKPNNILNFKKFFERELSNSLRAGSLEVPEDKKPVFATKQTYNFPENTETDQKDDLRLITGTAQGECTLTILPNNDPPIKDVKKNPYKYIKLQYKHFRDKIHKSAFAAGMQLLTDDEESTISIPGSSIPYIFQPSFYIVKFNDSFIVNVPVRFDLEISPDIKATNPLIPVAFNMELECINKTKSGEPCFQRRRAPEARIDTDRDLTSDISSTPITVTTFIQVRYKLNPNKKKKGLGFEGNTTKNNITTPGSGLLALSIRLKPNLNLEDPAILNKFIALTIYLLKNNFSYLQNENGSEKGFMFRDPAISKDDLKTKLDKDPELAKYADIIEPPYIRGSSICYIVDGTSYMDQEADYIYDEDFTPKPNEQIKANLADPSKFTISLKGILSGGSTNRDPTIYFPEILNKKTIEAIKKALEEKITATKKERYGVNACCTCCWVLKDIENKNVIYDIKIKAKK